MATEGARLELYCDTLPGIKQPNKTEADTITARYLGELVPNYHTPGFPSLAYSAAQKHEDTGAVSALSFGKTFAYAEVGEMPVLALVLSDLVGRIGGAFGFSKPIEGESIAKTVNPLFWLGSYIYVASRLDGEGNLSGVDFRNQMYDWNKIVLKGTGQDPSGGGGLPDRTIVTGSK